MEDMNTRVYNYKNISKVDRTGIEYVDSKGEKQFIDFENCKDNWVRYVNASGDFWGYRSTKEEVSCVGWRDIYAEPAYIEFFSNPKIKFIFPYKKTIFGKLIKAYSGQMYREFNKLQQQIIEGGWTTYDLS